MSAVATEELCSPQFAGTAVDQGGMVSVKCLTISHDPGHPEFFLAAGIRGRVKTFYAIVAALCEEVNIGADQEENPCDSP